MGLSSYVPEPMVIRGVAGLQSPEFVRRSLSPSQQMTWPLSFVSMSDAIFVLPDGGHLVEMRPEGYLTEAALQKLVGDHPALLPGSAMNSRDPRRFVLVRREAGLADSEASGARWWVDHVFLDQDGIPTLVEVKRASDTRIRREVVGQMLDYAAYAVAYWTLDQLRAWFGDACEVRGKAEGDVLLSELGVEDPEDFWDRVKTNLQAGRLRLLFVADRIPVELRRVVEFLNVQLNPAEVLAVEIGQYRGSDFSSFVPRLLGQTERAQAAKSAGPSMGPRLDLDASLAILDSVPAVRDLAHATVAWAGMLGLGFRTDRLAQVLPMLEAGGIRYPLFSVHQDGQVHIPFAWLADTPEFADKAPRAELAEVISAVVGVPIRSIAGHPIFAAELLEDEARRAAFFGVFERLIERVRGLTEVGD